MSDTTKENDELDNKCNIYCNTFFNMFKHHDTNDIKNDCISSCISGSTCSSGNIGHQIGGQLELKDSFGWYIPLHKLPTDPKMAMPHIALNYKPQNITLTTDDFDKKDANHNK